MNIYHKSASLKALTEGGTIDGLKYSTYSIDPDSEQAIMNVTLESIDEFEMLLEAKCLECNNSMQLCLGCGIQRQLFAINKQHEHYSQRLHQHRLRAYYWPRSICCLFPTNISIQKKGRLLDYPWPIEDSFNTTFDIYNTHSTSNAASGDVWFSLDNTGTLFDGVLKYKYYFTTYGNTAMIKTGHRECNATEI